MFRNCWNVIKRPNLKIHGTRKMEIETKGIEIEMPFNKIKAEVFPNYSFNKGNLRTRGI